MNSLPRVTFVIDQFAVPSPGQQLLDRFLVGYHSDGTFRVPGCEVVFVGNSAPALDARAKEFGLRIAPEALKSADAVVIAAGENRVRNVLQQLNSGARCFIHGLLSPTSQEIATQRGIIVLSGTASGAAVRLPEIALEEGALRKCFIVTNGSAAVLDGLEALRSVVEARLGKLIFVRKLVGAQVWDLAYSNEWRGLFAAAVSRSSTIKGDPEKDGRTQDIVGLHLVEKLVAQPRAWILDHGDGLQSLVLDLSGALDDLNFAVELADGSRRSAQLYRPPAPASDHFSFLADRIERFFRADLPETPRGLSNLWTAAEKMNA